MKLPEKKDDLPISFYKRNTVEVARDLVGKILIKKINRQWVGGIIVETEAYLSHGDHASHSHRGITTANSAMFQPAGTLYVYPIHTHRCFNVVTEKNDQGCAVLIRALEPIWGINQMITLRKTREIRQLARGPGRLCQSLAINRDHNGQNLANCKSIRIASSKYPAPMITTTKRIGISQDADLPLRFLHDGNWYVSGRAGDHHQRPIRPDSVKK